jgi:hypothetical protein
MADSVPITPGVGAPIATDDVGGVHYQRMKLVSGVDGVNDGDIAKTNPLPTRTGIALARDFSVAPITITASGFTQVIAANGTKTIKILGWAFKVASGQVWVAFRDNVGGITLLPAMFYANAGDGWVQDIIGQPYFVTGAGGNFGLNLTIAAEVTGVVFYTQE